MEDKVSINSGILKIGGFVITIGGIVAAGSFGYGVLNEKVDTAIRLATSYSQIADDVQQLKIDSAVMKKDMTRIILEVNLMNATVRKLELREAASGGLAGMKPAVPKSRAFIRPSESAK